MRHVLIIAFLLLAPVTLAVDLPVAPRETGSRTLDNVRPLVVPSGDAFVAVWSPMNLDPPRFARFRHTDEILLTGDLGRPGFVGGAVAGPDGSVLVAFSDREGWHLATIAPDGGVRTFDLAGLSFSSMAWNGSALLIVDREGNCIVTDANGRVLHQGAHLALPGNMPGNNISSASPRGNGFVVTWATGNDIIVTTLLGTGQVAKEEKIADRQISFSYIGCNPSDTCLLLSAGHEPLSGQILGIAPGPLFGISQAFVDHAIQPVWDGQRFLVVWTDYPFGEQSMRARVQVAAVTLDGGVMPIATIASPGHNRDTPAVASANGETMVVWEDKARCGHAGPQIMARSLSTSHELRITDGPRITDGLMSQWQPAIAAGATNALVAWTERSGEWRTRARLFPFTAPAFDISTGPAANAPVVGTDGGGGYLVAWRESLPEEEDCRTALRIRAPGSDTISTLGKDIDAIQVTWNGSVYVVLWEQTDPAQLFAMRVDRSGLPIDPAPVALTTADPERPYVAIDHEPAGLFWTGTGYLLVWRRSEQVTIFVYPYYPPVLDIYTTVLGPDLLPAGAPRTLGPGFLLAAAMKGNTIVAFWTKGTNTLHAVRLSADGNVLADHDLGIKTEPLRAVPTRSGYVVQARYELVLLDDNLSLIQRRPIEPTYSNVLIAIADTPGGLAEVYRRNDELFLHWPERRRRTMR